jgi:hypothetical protein
MLANVLALAESRRWPRTELLSGVAIGPGRDRWLSWTALATPERLAQARAALADRAHSPIGETVIGETVILPERHARDYVQQARMNLIAVRRAGDGKV